MVDISTKKLSRELRLEKYLGVLGNVNSYICPLTEDALQNFYFGGPRSNPLAANSKAVQMRDICTQLPNISSDYFGLYHFGDIRVEEAFPTITKTRPTFTKTRACKESYKSFNILTYIEKARHWDPVWDLIKKPHQDIPWCDKMHKAIWRGSLSNELISKTNPRMRLIKNFIDHPKIDVGITESLWSNSFPRRYIKPAIPMRKMLRYKYLICIEGNDIATNLKWAMYSKSLVLMPMPTCESWFLESWLIPWVHFVPISETMEDLESKILWCIHNDERCQQIVKNASEYISNFLDVEEETKLSTQVLESYFNRLTFTCTSDLRSKYGHLLEGKKNVIFI